jgi:hypothetical protein
VRICSVPAHIPDSILALEVQDFWVLPQQDDGDRRTIRIKGALMSKCDLNDHSPHERFGVSPECEILIPSVVPCVPPERENCVLFRGHVEF